MAYVVPETQQPVPLYFANRDAFVLSLPALRQDLQSSRAIPYPLDETVYRARKSTRQFTAEALSAETINSLYEALPGWLTQQMAQEEARCRLHLWPGCWPSAPLSVRRSARCQNIAILPPAASMRCKCISAPAAMGEYAAGYYYYHPLEQHLYRAEASGSTPGLIWTWWFGGKPSPRYMPSAHSLWRR